MAARPSISIVGPGRLGRALAENLVRVGYVIDEIVFSDAKSLRRNRKNLSRKLRSLSTTSHQAHFNADLIWLCVQDTQIESVARNLKSATQWKGKTVFHSSGALTSDALQALRKQGAAVASIHPLMTFVHGPLPNLADVSFALEGDPAALRVGRQIIRSLGGDAFVVSKRNKLRYHAWATLLSPLLLSFLVGAEQAAKSVGIAAKDARKKMLPIVKQTLSNYITIGPAGAFSGPLVRGDVNVVREHLTALKVIPEGLEVYKASAKSALRHLPVRNRKLLEALLKTS